MHLKEEPFGVAVIGGGASGLAAAVSAARQNPRGGVVLLEKQDRVGKKLLATGNGRCNLSNRFAQQERCYFGDSAFARRVLQSVSPAETLDFFRSLGLETFEEEEGRVYPCGEQASAVLDLLRAGAAGCGVTEETEFPVESAEVRGGLFLVHGAAKTISARRLVVACGGAAAPSLGGTMSGYELLGAFGHRRTRIFAALCPIRTEEALVRPLKGVRCKAKVTLLADGEPVASERGEVQFAQGALSGICVFQLSRFAGEFFTAGTVCGKRRRSLSLSLALLERTEREVSALLQNRRRLLRSLPAEQFLTGLFHKKIGFELLRTVVQKPSGKTVGELSDGELAALGRLICDWRFPVTGASGFAQAQVTAGGVETGGFSPLTMESVYVPGLFACGEVLNVDGLCGGYNLQWAWSSGILAGRTAGKA
ncbi:MAG: aminoacetone oxidase family FAD-binding enzyme [Firmicutes bacterium]|nr:aminoacetone oxidase family FAD-binding enzyme [Bacillota bacterium]